MIAKEELEGGSDDVVRLLEESSGLLSGRGLRGLYSYNSRSSYSGEDQYLIKAASTNTAVTSNTSSSSVGNASVTAADVGHKYNDIPAVSHGIESFNSTDSHYENQNQNENRNENRNQNENEIKNQNENENRNQNENENRNQNENRNENRNEKSFHAESTTLT